MFRYPRLQCSKICEKPYFHLQFLSMKVLVPVKRVIDYRVNIRVKSDQSGVETQGVKMAINPFDEIAVEEALRLRETGYANEVIVITIGGQACQETLRVALAIGADSALQVMSDKSHEPLLIAKILQKMVERVQPGLVIMGKQAIDDDCNQTGQMLAALLGWPQGTFVSKINILDDKVEVTREIDGGLETLLLMLPAVLTTDLRLNEPRYVSLPNIMKAKQKPLDVIELGELGLDLTSHTKIVKVTHPPERKHGIKVKSVNELIDKLKLEAKVLE